MQTWLWPRILWSMQPSEADCFIVAFRTGTTHNICYLFLKLLLHVCFRLWKESNSIICCLYFILETVHVRRRNLSSPWYMHVQMTVHARSDFPPKKCSCFEVQKLHQCNNCTVYLFFFYSFFLYICLFPRRD